MSERNRTLAVIVSACVLVLAFMPPVIFAIGTGLMVVLGALSVAAYMHEQRGTEWSLRVDAEVERDVLRVENDRLVSDNMTLAGDLEQAYGRLGPFLDDKALDLQEAIEENLALTAHTEAACDRIASVTPLRSPVIPIQRNGGAS